MTAVDAWAKWAETVERRLAQVERDIAPDGLLVKALGEALGRLRRELREAGNDIRRRLDMPEIMASKPRYRRPAGSAPWP